MLRNLSADLSCGNDFVKTTSLLSETEHITLFPCGIYSHFHINSPGNPTALSAQCFPHKIIMHAQVDILSANAVQTRVIKYPFLNRKGISFSVAHWMYVQILNTSVIDYHIVTSIYQVVVLMLNTGHEPDVTVFDGPGYLSEKLPLINKKWKNSLESACSTYQCIVQLVTCVATAVNFNQFAAYKSAAIKLKHQEHTRHTVLTFPSTKDHYSRTYLKGILLTSARNFSMNVSLGTFSYQGQESLDCRFGGMFYFALVSNTFQDIATLCMADVHLQSNLPRMFSFSNKLLLLGNFYDKYSLLNVVAQVHTTKCKLIRLSLCEFRASCNSGEHSPNCRQYFENIYAHISTVLVSFVRSHVDASTLAIKLNSKHTCWVLQGINNNPRYFEPLLCNVYLETWRETMDHEFFSFAISGYFSSDTRYRPFVSLTKI